MQNPLKIPILGASGRCFFLLGKVLVILRGFTALCVVNRCLEHCTFDRKSAVEAAKFCLVPIVNYRWRYSHDRFGSCSVPVCPFQDDSNDM